MPAGGRDPRWLEAEVGAGIRAVVPGQREAAELKQALIDEGMWSQYLEVAIGPDAEVFSKSPVLSTVGCGRRDRRALGLRRGTIPSPKSCWRSIRAAKSSARRSATTSICAISRAARRCCSKAKDNNASCAIGPFIRLFDGDFTIDDVRQAEVDLTIEGPEGYRLEGQQPMGQISRDPRRAGPPGAERASLSRRLRPVPRHAVRADPGPRRAGRRLHPQARRHGDDLDAEARHAGQHGHHVARRAAMDIRHRRADAQSRRARAAVDGT